MLRLSAQQSLPPLVDLGSKSVPGLGKAPFHDGLEAIFCLGFVMDYGVETPSYLNMTVGRKTFYLE